MPSSGWKRLLDGFPWFAGEGRYPVPAYSEFMPPPRLIRKPYGELDLLPVADDDPWGWPISEYDEALALRPGLQHIARQIVGTLAKLGQGKLDHGLAPGILEDNPYWPAELSRRAGALAHEQYVALLPLALSWTQDDKGRVRWTLFGGSEQGPDRAFWQGFFTAPGQPLAANEGLAFFRRLLRTVYGLAERQTADLRQAGLRILPRGKIAKAPFGDEGPLPSWTSSLLWRADEPIGATRFLLTFAPFAALPPAVRRAYLAGELHLLPFPGSLIFWGASSYYRLQRHLPFALQMPLLQQVSRFEGLHGIRVAQSGWFHGAAEDAKGRQARHGPLRATYQRTRRHARILRHADELATAKELKLIHALFSTAADDLELYSKPMARNVQLWTEDFELLLDGPRADPAAIQRAYKAVERPGWFGYRFLYPPMRVGLYELYYHRPLVAYMPKEADHAAVLNHAPLGYITAYDSDHPDLAQPIELWPRLLRRELHVANLELFEQAEHDEAPHRTLRNIAKLLYAREALGRPTLPRAFARRLLTLDKKKTLASWLNELPGRASHEERGREFVAQLNRCLEPAGSDDKVGRGRSLTFGHTARRSFEVAYWKTIAFLSGGDYLNKNNADCVLDAPTQAALKHHRRDLEALGGYLLSYYRGLVRERRLESKVAVGELPFQWQSHFEFPWMGGWLHNQTGATHERNLVTIIPGKDRRHAVIFADHYDTAYREDRYEKEQGGNGARLATPGADDNASATATLMQAAPIFFDLSRRGRLGRDVWLVHLTGEEFPGEGVGANRLCQWLAEQNLKLRLADGAWKDLSGVKIEAVVVMDMIGHNAAKGRDIFQIAPGSGPDSMALAYEAHRAAEAWNAGTRLWNRRPSRRWLSRGKRSRSADKIPATALHLPLHGEVRPHDDPYSTLYNTDGQVFADTGIPVILLMENYDIDRRGYHDSYDTMANINLDYGAAIAAIAIETVARLACRFHGA